MTRPGLAVGPNERAKARACGLPRAGALCAARANVGARGSPWRAVRAAPA